MPAMCWCGFRARRCAVRTSSSGTRARNLPRAMKSSASSNSPGGYAEYLPVPENCLLPVPDDIEDSLAPLLLDTIGTSAHAVRFVARVVPSHEAGPVLVTG